MTGEEGETTEGPRHIAAKRRVVRVVQVVAVVVADIWLARLVAGAGMTSVSIVALVVCVPAVIVTRWWSGSRARLLGSTGPKARWRGWILVVLSVALMGVAVWQAAAPAHPSGSISLDSRTTCGSALWPRSETSGPLAGGLPGFTFADECAPAIRTSRGQAAFAALASAELFLLVTSRPTRLRKSSDTAQRPLLLQRPAPIFASLLVLALLAGTVTALRTQAQVRRAHAFDAATVQWSLRLEVATFAVSLPFQTMLPDIKARDYAALAKDCQKVERPLAQYNEVAGTMPPEVAALANPEVTRFADDVRRAIDACLRGAKAHDWTIFKTQVQPALFDAASDSEKLKRDLYVR